jgi:hypothetical protein
VTAARKLGVDEAQAVADRDFDRAGGDRGGHELDPLGGRRRVWLVAADDLQRRLAEHWLGDLSLPL